jgi:protein-L-isoaspartate(D-aspartate) O-methyltransferase
VVNIEKYQVAREKMVQEQLVERNIKDQRVLDAMRKVPRHLFVEKKFWNKAYDDSPIQIECSQTISQPYMVAIMTELLELKGDEKVLEIGTGSGYQTAILAELAKEVFSIERHSILVTRATLLLEDLGYTNVHIKLGNGTIGWPDNTFFDAMIVAAGAPEIPEELLRQLKSYGKLVIPVGTNQQQDLLLVSKRGDSYLKKKICACVFVPLIGANGWAE